MEVRIAHPHLDAGRFIGPARRNDDQRTPQDPVDQVVFTTPAEPAKLADLIPTRLDLNNPAPGTGDPVTMWLTVANRGEADAGAFHVTVQDGLGYQASARVGGIRQGGSGRVLVGTLLAGRSPWQLTARVDTRDEVEESNERNNAGSKTVITRDQTATPRL
jgi:hypothetical protein